MGAQETDNLRRLRHELRTPINHILGYTELLLDQAEEVQRPEFIADLRRIQTAGKQLLKPVVDRLDADETELQPDELAQLSLELRTPLTAVVGYTDLLLDDAAADLPGTVSADLQRVRQAARSLLDLVGTVVDPRSTPPARAHVPELSLGRLSAPALDGGQLTGHVLIVDDSAANRDILARRLARLGCRVSCADNGQAALEQLAAGDIDLLLLDVMMPGLSGFDVLAIRRQDPHLQDVPVIVLSAVDGLESAVRCIELGADDYLLKPYDSVLLRARIGACLERKRLRDREREYVRLLALEREKSERLLRNMLPELIAARLKEAQSPSIIADTLDEVSVLFADLVGFTTLSARVSPQAMVAMLNRIFSAFDGLAEQHGLEKIKTIGDGYEVIAGAPIPRADHAEAVAEMALRMQAVIGELSQESGWPLDIRIGIDTGGPVVAGVIGQHKYVYEVWGDCVNTASRMESHGLPGSIQVTQAAYERLRERYTFEERGTIDVKSKGVMQTYLLTGRRALSRRACGVHRGGAR